MAIGAASGICGIIFALAQHDFKRLLAYHSVENIGIITLGLGLGVLGLSMNYTPLILLGMTGALLHVINHAIYKGLLFLGAGAVLHATGTRQMDELGGLLRKIPGVAAAFLIGAIAICGLPPLNGFLSEFLIYLAAFQGGQIFKASTFVPCLLTILSLSIFGGLSLVSFTKVFGIVFLGEPREQHSQAHQDHAPHGVGRAISFPIYILAAACVTIGLSAPIVIRQVAMVLSRTTPFQSQFVQADWNQMLTPLPYFMIIGSLLLLLILLFHTLRRNLLSHREVSTSGTWDCGYACPTARMQYTSSSFAQPLVNLFRPLLRTHVSRPPIKGYFPKPSTFITETRDLFMTHLYSPLFFWVDRRLVVARKFQHGRIQGYILYILLTLIALLIWHLEFAS